MSDTKNIDDPAFKPLFIELGEALDAMPVKELIDEVLFDGNECCSLGAWLRYRGLDVNFDRQFSIAEALRIPTFIVSDIEFENDVKGPVGETNAERWTRMRAWANERIAKHE